MLHGPCTLPAWAWQCRPVVLAESEGRGDVVTLPMQVANSRKWDLVVL